MQTADPIDLENALGEELVRANLLGGPRPFLAGRYHVTRVVGRGAFGLVVEARDERLERVVALKMFPAFGSDSELLREARALARLDHPNVVRVHDADVAEFMLDGQPFRVVCVSLQMLHGESLRHWISAATRSSDEILHAFTAAGYGLAAAHAVGIVHRDFKPDNVVIGDDGAVRVIDFGFAAAPVPSSVFDDPDRARDLALPVAGTDRYLAPEARQGLPTARADQYAFAVSLWEALTGGAPEEKRGGAAAPSNAALERVLRRAMHADPAERFPSMTALIGAIEKAATAPRRARWAAVVTAFVVVVSVIGLGFTRGSTLEPTPSAPSLATASCASLGGTWWFESVVESRGDTGGAPVRGMPDVGTTARYRLELVSRSGCELEGTLVREKSARPSATPSYDVGEEARSDPFLIVARPAGGGYRADISTQLAIGPRRAVCLEHEFELTWRGDHFDGRFRAAPLDDRSRCRTGEVAGYEGDVRDGRKNRRRP